MKVLKLFSLTIIGLLMAMLMQGCSQQEEPEVKKGSAQRTVLVYAIGSNNLDSYLRYDKAEMLEAASAIDGLGKKIRVLLYEVPSTSSKTAILSELKKSTAGTYEFQEIKNYDRETYSTDPVRMREVFADVKSYAPSVVYGLVLWSHATGWKPEFSEHGDSSAKQRSFGVDTDSDGTDFCDIIELADAIPGDMFDYIWFDCCYMMQIEVAYQLRDKCEYIGGYPTEDWAEGMNYDATLPLLAKPTPDLTGVARKFFDFYDSRGDAATVTVVSTKGLERLAAVCRDIYLPMNVLEGSFVGWKSELQNYSRLRTAPGMYDFGQFTLKLTDMINGTPSLDLPAAFEEALDETVVWGQCTASDFNGRPAGFNPDIYSGFSCHLPGSGTQEQEDYYRLLDWVKAVYLP